MKLFKDDESKHPELLNYIKSRLPTVLHRKRIVDALVKYAELSRAQLKTALQYGTPPEIRVVHQEPQVCGRFDGARMEGILWHWIEIDETLVKDFEREMKRRGKRAGYLAQVVGVVLLHELTHWGDHRDGRQQVTVTGKRLEEGDQFEKEAYGRTLTKGYRCGRRVIRLPAIPLVPLVP